MQRAEIPLPNSADPYAEATIGRRLFALRIAKGLKNRRKFVALVNDWLKANHPNRKEELAYTTVIAWDKGSAQPEREHLIAACAVLEVLVDDVISGRQGAATSVVAAQGASAGSSVAVAKVEGLDWRRSARRWFQLAGIVEGTARWDLTWSRIERARGREGATDALVQEMIDILVGEERDGVAPEVAEARAARELKRRELAERGIIVQPGPPPAESKAEHGDEKPAKHTGKKARG